MCPIVARLLHAADHLSARYSTTVERLPTVVPPHATADLGEFRRAVAEYFQVDQLRGRLCHIDPVARGRRLLLFVYLDDYTAVSVGFDAAARLERRPHRPTFEVVYQFDHAAGTLSVFAKGGQPVRLTLLDLFCRHVLGAERPSGVALRPRYRLDHLLSRDATAPLDPTGGVTGVRIRRLRGGVPRTDESVMLDTAPEGSAGGHPPDARPPLPGGRLPPRRVAGVDGDDHRRLHRRRDEPHRHVRRDGAGDDRPDLAGGRPAGPGRAGAADVGVTGA